MLGTGEQTPNPPSIDNLSEQELRQETVERVNLSLGELPVGPLADGSAMNGYKRGEQDLSSLRCSYFQFSKAYEGETQVGVQIALFGLFNSPSITLYYTRKEVEKRLEGKGGSDEERKELDSLINKIRQLEESIAKDGIAPADNRYYFIPQDPIQPAIVSTESFIARAHKINPQRAERGFLPELITKAKEAENQPIDPESGQPRSKIANLQDLRDALTITRRGDQFVKEIIENTPSEYWGRPGLTD